MNTISKTLTRKMRLFFMSHKNFKQGKQFNAKEYDNVKEIVVFGHNDLDMAGSLLNLNFALPNVKKHVFETNYANIQQITANVVQHFNENLATTKLFILDVSFGDNLNSLKTLYEIPGVEITHIDHHLYPNGFWNVFPKMNVFYSPNVCATVLSNVYFNVKNENLEKLSQLIDVYDMWRTKNAAFETSQCLNTYFWWYVKINSKSLEMLCDEIKTLNYKLPKNFKTVVEMMNTENDKKVKNYRERGLVQRAKNVVFVFVDDCFNEIMIQEMNENAACVVGITSYGIVRVRFNADSDISSNQKRQIRLTLAGSDAIGHENVMTYKIQGNTDFNKIILEAKRISETLNENIPQM